MAASSGLSHEAYNSAHPAGSPLYFPDPLVAADCAAALNFPELDAVRPTDYLLPPVFGAIGSEMNMQEQGIFPMTSSYYCDGYAAASGRGGFSTMTGRPTGRIGFRTRSEVEVMDDGFRWRKYGKKAVKGSPNLRNYYRCSAEGCGVKKRVERDGDDPRFVLTTYVGVHNHATPGGSSRTTPVYLAPGAPAWTWSELHSAAAAHSSESYC